MTIHFQQPKYILPLLLLPFVVLFFDVYKSNAGPPTDFKKEQPGINSAVGEVAENIRKRDLSDKLEAYRDVYKEADGRTAVSPVPVDQTYKTIPTDQYSNRNKRVLDSIQGLMQQHGKNPSKIILPKQDQAMIDALNHLHQPPQENIPHQEKEKDPMELFKQQLAIMDSIGKSNDPEVKAEMRKKASMDKLTAEHTYEKALSVHKPKASAVDFNTVRPEPNDQMIAAVIDENVTGYAGSRIRMRLLEDLIVGNTLIKKGTYLYGQINGFSEQRVNLVVKSIYYEQQILPVELDLYDLDGLPGLYVPESTFRDFTKDLGTNTIQGITLDGSSSFVTSMAGRIFQSTSSAIAGMIKKNKVKLKYNSFIYLIDRSILNNSSKNY